MIMPTYDLIENFSRIYKWPVALFLLNTPPEEKPIPTDFRTVSAGEINKFHEKTYLAVRKARRLILSAIALYEDSGINIPSFDIRSDLSDNPEEIAKILRNKFNTRELLRLDKYDNSLDFLINEFESKGIFVFQLSMTQDNIRGFSITDEKVPAIVIKRSKEEPQAKIFTLFHELGHLLLDNAGMCDLVEMPETKQIEKWCNHLAGATLVPMDQLIANEQVKLNLNNQPDWDDSLLLNIGKVFKVSKEVILRRLLIGGLTTREYYEGKREEWSKSSPGYYGRGKPDKIKIVIQERGENYTKIALRAFENNILSVKDLADYMDIRIDQVNQVKEYVK
jgi:Zn-dependent peptidase ImmA (M78 family)